MQLRQKRKKAGWIGFVFSVTTIFAANAARSAHCSTVALQSPQGSVMNKCLIVVGEMFLVSYFEFVLLSLGFLLLRQAFVNRPGTN